MHIHQLFNNNPLRNFTYILSTAKGWAYVIDPWEAPNVLDYLKKSSLRLKAIFNTHEHYDHIEGNAELVAQTGCEVWVHQRAKAQIVEATKGFKDEEIVALDDNCEMKFLDTPGHTFSHMCLAFMKQGKLTSIFTGDTLFNAGVGNCKNGGEVGALFESVDGKLAQLGDDVCVYPGHDYMENNLRFTLSLTPNNEDAQLYLERTLKLRESGEFLLTTIGEEKKINTFLQLEDETLKNALAMPLASKREVFIKLRSMRDHW